MRAFFDTSALSKRYLQEKGSDRVEGIFRDASSVGISVIALPETVSALCRLKKDGLLSAGVAGEIKAMLFRDAEDMAVCLVTAEVVRAAVRMLEGDGLRTLDALHLGTAVEWGAELFVTADKRQAAAARRAGLAVLAV